MEIDDKEIREELSKILGSYKERDCYMAHNYGKADVKVLSWIEIASEIGKLKKK